MVFRDRTDAGRQLAAAIRDRGVDADLVLAIPRGGLPLGYEVAEALGVPLDIVVARKLGAPGNPEYAIGAVATDGSVWRNERAIRGLGIDAARFEEIRRREEQNAREKAARYRDTEAPLPDVRDKTVIIADDGIATGSTARACIEAVRNAGAASVVLAVPVGPPDSIDSLASTVDEVVCLETPAAFSAVGQFYERFDQVSDEEAMEYLGRGNGKRGRVG